MEQEASTRRILAHHISYGALERGPYLEANWQHRDSSIFRRMKIAEPSFRKDRSCLQRVEERVRVIRKSHLSIQQLLQASWMKTAFVLVLSLAIAYFHLKSPGSEPYSISEWKWDHNVYNPRQPMVGSNVTHVVETVQPAHNSNEKRNLLLAQFSGSPALDIMASICSRPNRAYARQWGRDYVRYTGASHTPLERACFDKVYLLDVILNRQVHSDSLWPPSSHVQYDAVVLLPPDAIITDLDSDLLNLFPSDKLFGIASYEHSTTRINDSTFSEVLFFNLRHKYATETVELWNSLTAPPVTCGAGNDIRLLLDAVGSLVKSEEERDEIVADIGLSAKGFLGERSIKIIPQKVPSSKAVLLVSNTAETKADLQTTADSVCYRYYPRCDVVL